MNLPLSGLFGVYIHIPFCRHRCDYCAFATWTDRDHLIGDYLDALRVDIERASLAPVTSVFIGGGTPTRVPAVDLAAVLAAVPVVTGAEVTVECNPDDVTAEMMRVYAATGVNRISLGVQSMVPSVLAALGRTHVPTNVERAVEAIRAAGIPTFNLDIIYGGSGETLDDWRATLEGVLDLEPPHVSAYALTVEAGTPLAEDPSRHPDDDDLADKYELADDLLTAEGLPNYEVSNWAVPGHECRHNVLYWQQGNYRGFGSAAHSPPRRPSLVERAHARAVCRGRCVRRVDRGGRRDARRRNASHRGLATGAEDDRWSPSRGPGSEWPRRSGRDRRTPCEADAPWSATGQ